MTIFYLKVDMGSLETPLPEPPKYRRSHSRGSRKSAKSERSVQSSARRYPIQESPLGRGG